MRQYLLGAYQRCQNGVRSHAGGDALPLQISPLYYAYVKWGHNT